MSRFRAALIVALTLAVTGCAYFGFEDDEPPPTSAAATAAAAPATTTTTEVVPATTEAMPETAADAGPSELEWACESLVGLPLHDLGGFSDDFWGDVYKAEVRASRDAWLVFCGARFPEIAHLMCDLVAADALPPTDGDRHEEIMSAVAERLHAQHCSAH